MLDRYGHVRDTEIRRAVTGNAAHVADAMKTGATNVATATKTAVGALREVRARNMWSVKRLAVASLTGFEPVFWP